MVHQQQVNLATFHFMYPSKNLVTMWIRLKNKTTKQKCLWHAHTSRGIKIELRYCSHPETLRNIHLVSPTRSRGYWGGALVFASFKHIIKALLVQQRPGRKVARVYFAWALSVFSFSLPCQLCHFAQPLAAFCFLEEACVVGRVSCVHFLPTLQGGEERPVLRKVPKDLPSKPGCHFLVVWLW